MADTIRLNLEISPKVKERIAKLQTTPQGKISQVEVFRKALSLLELYEQTQEQGGKLQVILPGAEPETIRIL